MDLVDLTEDQANTLEVLSTARVNVINALANIQGLLKPAQASKSPAKVMQTKTYKELEDEFGNSSGQTSTDSGFGTFSAEDLDAMFGGLSASASPSAAYGRKASGKTYAEIDATACLGDPYPKTPKRYRQQTFQSVTPTLIDIGSPDYQQWSRQRSATPTRQQQSPLRARSSPRLDYYQSPAACAYRPQSAPKAPVSKSLYQSSTPRSPSSVRRVLQMPETIEISDDEDTQMEEIEECAASSTPDLNDFNAMVKMQVERMKQQIDRQNALKKQKQRRLQLEEEERLRHDRSKCQQEAEQQAFRGSEEYWTSYY